MKKYIIGDLCDVVKGNIPIMKAVEGEYPLVTTGAERKTHNEWQFDGKAVCVPLVSSTGHGHASIKRIHYQQGKFALGNILAAMLPKDETVLDAEYLYIYLSLMKDEILVPLMKGTANVSLTVKSLKSVTILVPSLQEQVDIVNKVNRINNPRLNLYKYIFSQEANIAKLRQSVLQDAIHGKIVPQDESDEPASIIIEKIKQEKERLIKEKKIKKEKPLPEITDDEKPFELPGGWMWVRLIDICSKVTDGSHNPPPKKDKGFPMISAKNIVNNDLTLTNVDRYVNELEFEKENKRTNISKNDVLLGIIGGSIGKTAIVKIDTKMVAQRSIAIFTTYLECNYFRFILDSPYIQKVLKEASSGTAQGGVYLNTLKSLLVPVPPVQEQKRIVQKVEQLMDLCDELKVNIEQSKLEIEQLTKAVLQEAFTVKEEVLN